MILRTGRLGHRSPMRVAFVSILLIIDKYELGSYFSQRRYRYYGRLHAWCVFYCTGTYTPLESRLSTLERLLVQYR
jgi:hypothetical protein